MRKRLVGILILAGCASAKPEPQPVVVSTPVETSVKLCVVDTVAPGGMMVISAIQSGADTTVLQASGRVPIQQAVAGPKVIGDVTFVTAKQPLSLGGASRRVRYAWTGSPRTFAPGSIGLLGMFRGLPLYALLNEGGPMRGEVESYAARGMDLEKALSSSARLRSQLSKVRFLYAPVSLVGCSFQTLGRLKR
jgi:hypothetical protein